MLTALSTDEFNAQFITCTPSRVIECNYIVLRVTMR